MLLNSKIKLGIFILYTFLIGYILFLIYKKFFHFKEGMKINDNNVLENSDGQKLVRYNNGYLYNLRNKNGLLKCDDATYENEEINRKNCNSINNYIQTLKVKVSELLNLVTNKTEEEDSLYSKLEVAKEMKKKKIISDYEIEIQEAEKEYKKSMGKKLLAEEILNKLESNYPKAEDNTYIYNILRDTKTIHQDKLVEHDSEIGGGKNMHDAPNHFKTVSAEWGSKIDEFLRGEDPFNYIKYSDIKNQDLHDLWHSENSIIEKEEVDNLQDSENAMNKDE